MKFNVLVCALYKNLWMKREFCKNQHRLSHNLLPGKKEFVLVIHIYVHLLAKFGIEDLHIMMVSNWEFREKRCSRIHT